MDRRRRDRKRIRKRTFAVVPFFAAPDLRDIVVYYEELNADGQRVARERIEELTQIYKYQREEKHPPENAQDAQDAAGDAPKDTDHKNS